MNAVKQRRTTIRGAFTKSANNLEDLLSSELSNVKFDEIEVTLEQLSVKFKQLKECDDQALDLLQQEKCSQDIYEKEYLSCEKYEDRFIALKTKVNRITKPLSNEDGSSKIHSLLNLFLI
ncbi:integrase catalytic domain-containing protein [Trichonephila clavata]|uniref:Integrase catalytic domain-containing protein n=1 Tax=Trichonephila clavata TaxID=2740835 RepID=A0A8X6I2Y2_TRICU|nr:integrase catalytic domain-containing protein [Trichonephila clavata]